MMDRMECLKILRRHVTDEVVIATYSSANDWIRLSDRPLDYYAFGAMGLASSHALGIALARPDKRVIVLDGDGSLLMNLGTLVTIAAVAPGNLVHLVFHNGSYEANGGLPIPNQSVDFSGLARAAGIASCHSFRDLAAFESGIGAVLSAPGPALADLWIEQGEINQRDYSEMYNPRRREAFRAALLAVA